MPRGGGESRPLSARLPRGSGGQTIVQKGVALSPATEPTNGTEIRGGSVDIESGGRIGDKGADPRSGGDRFRPSTLDDEIPFLSGFAAVGSVSVCDHPGSVSVA